MSDPQEFDFLTADVFFLVKHISQLSIYRSALMTILRNKNSFLAHLYFTAVVVLFTVLAFGVYNFQPYSWIYYYPTVVIV